jgi:hypothetical protein
MQNTFIVRGQTFSIEALDSALDEEFVALHAAFLGSSTCQWASFSAAAHAYFSKPMVGGHQHGLFFNNFTILWRHFLGAGQFDAAEAIWRMACDIAWAWESSNNGKLIHKGTPYYFWGMTAILRGDLDRGYALMHQALEEDVRVSGNPFPDTPALALVTMNAQKMEQVAHDWVARKAAIADRFLMAYRRSSGRNLDFGLLNSRFLQRPPNRHTVYSLSYVLGRLVKLSEAPSQVLGSGFAAQLNMELISRLLQVIESSIKAKDPADNTFLPLAVHLLQAAKLPLTQADLQHVNEEAQKDFEGTVRDLLDGKFTLPTRGTASGLSRDLAIAYACRNYGAHQLTPSATLLKRIDEIRQAVFNVLFITVEALY